MHLALAAVVAALVLALPGCGDDDKSLILATTTSTQDSGLLDELLPAFERESGYSVKPIAIGSGEAIELAERGEADVVLAHSPGAEEELMATGKAGERRLVMHNDFVVVGPLGDPARIAGRAPDDALARIARSGSPFVSRGDDSGTHAAELGLWEAAGMKPAGDWYAETGQGMGATLRVVDEQRAYTLSDRGTYLSQPGGLELLVEEDPELLNVYHVIAMTRAAGSRVDEQGATEFARWLVAPDTQREIGSFGVERYGEPLFTPDAGKPEPGGG